MAPGDAVPPRGAAAFRNPAHPGPSHDGHPDLRTSQSRIPQSASRPVQQRGTWRFQESGPVDAAAADRHLRARHAVQAAPRDQRDLVGEAPLSIPHSEGASQGSPRGPQLGVPVFARPARHVARLGSARTHPGPSASAADVSWYDCLAPVTSVCQFSRFGGAQVGHQVDQ
jgi:hypothetical protein